jgi:hypothetical protein
MKAVYYTYHYIKTDMETGNGMLGDGRTMYRLTPEEASRDYPKRSDILAMESRLLRDNEYDHVHISWWKEIDYDEGESSPPS